MGCASSASTPAQGDEGPDAKTLAGRQRRKLSVAPGHVGDITSSEQAAQREDEIENTEVNMTEIAQKAKTLARLEHVFLSRKGFVPYSKKKTNQDRYVLKYGVGDEENLCMFGVMDGHGEFGHDVSEFVKQNLPVYLGQRAKLFLNEENNVAATLDDAVMSMCRELASSSINCSFSGTTCVFGVLINGNQLHVANIGDSRCVMAQRNDDGTVTALDLSTDHKPESPIEEARIKAAGGRVQTLPGPPGEDCGPFRVWLNEVDVPGLAMSRSIGDDISQSVGVISNPEVVHHEVVPRDMFCVFASDGVWEFITSQDAIDLVWKYRANMKNAAQNLVDAATNRWKEEEEVIDDITCTIMQFNPFD